MLLVNVVTRADQAPPKRDKQDHADQEVHHGVTALSEILVGTVGVASIRDLWSPDKLRGG